MESGWETFIPELGHKGGESWLVFIPLLLTLCLPASRILPVQIQSVKVVFLNKADNMVYELPPGHRVVHEATVLVTLAVIPTSDGDADFYSTPLKVCKLLVIFYKA